MEGYGLGIIHLATHGFSANDLALALVRFFTGLFFAISGFNKLFHPVRHQSLKNNLTKNGIPFVPFMVWWVAGWEFVAGTMLALGFLSAFSAGVLLIVCLVAMCCEASKKVEAYKPINKGDVVADYLYLPETLYILLLLVTLLAGTGGFSLDALLFPL